MSGFLPRGRGQWQVASDAAALRSAWGMNAPAEARRRIEAEVARISLGGINHWTSVWFVLMRVPADRSLAA